MKVLLFSTGFPEYMIELARGLSAYQQVILMLPSNHRLTSRHVELIDDRVIFEPFEVIFYKSVRQNLKMIIGIIKVIRKYRPQIVHLQSNGHRWFPLVYFFLPKGIKLVNTIHDPIKHLGDEVSLRQDDRLSIFFGKLFTDKYIVHGNYLMKQLAATYGLNTSRIEVIPHGHLEIYKQFQKEKGTHKPIRFLFFGRIWRYKGLDYFIKAANQVIKKFPETKFTIAGQGEDIQTYLNQIEFPENFEVDNRRIPIEEAGTYFQSSSVVVLPYIDGSQSGVVPVAYAYGKPVIVTQIGAIPEVVDDGETGFIIPPKSETALIEKMIYFINHPDKIEVMGNKAHQKAKSYLSWTTIGQKTNGVYLSLLNL